VVRRGGRLAAELTLPRLRRRWDPSQGTAAQPSGAFRFTAPEQDAIFDHAARQAAAAAEHIRCSARSDPGRAADAAWAAADALHVAARANPELRRAAGSYDRAARARYGQIPGPSREGNQLRAAARLMAMAGTTAGDATLVTIALVANLVALAIAVAELREAQHLAAQAAAARAAAAQLHAAGVPARSSVPGAGQAPTRRRSRPATAADVARTDVAMPWRPRRPPAAGPGRPSPRRGPLPPRRAGPGG
jgi:hypothetical protein